MNFRECSCHSEDGCDACNRTGKQRQCSTCGRWYPSHTCYPTMEDHTAEWSCGPCHLSCFNCSLVFADVEAMAWLGQPTSLNRTAHRVRLCECCYKMLDGKGEILHPDQAFRRLDDDEQG